MEYKNKLASTVKAFWDGDGLFLDDTEGRKKAITRATKDLMARTLKRIASETESFNDAVICVLLPKIDEWFSLPQAYISQDTFDDWHSRACKEILSVLRAFYTNQDGTPVAYGKAQKIVNMSMKGLYCLEGAMAAERNLYFQHCHIALDSFTLEWFKRVIIEPDKALVKGKVDSWSALQNLEADEYENNQKTYYCYHKIVGLIRNHFSVSKPFDGLTPLQAEFFIWSEIQLEMAAEALYAQEASSEDAVDYMLEYLSRIRDLDNRVEKIKNAKEKFSVCKKLFREMSVGEKLIFLENRIKKMRSLYPVEADVAAYK